MCPSVKLKKVDRGSGRAEEEGRESSGPEKLNTRDDGDDKDDGDDDKPVEDEVRVSKKSTVLPKSKENEEKQSSSMLENCGNKAESRRRFSQSSTVMVREGCFS